MANGFSKLTWLKRTHGHEFTGAEFRVLISVFNHSGADGSNSHPGLKVLMAETGYGKSAVSDALTALQEKGWIAQTFRGSGVSGRTSVYNLVPDAPSCTAVADQPESVGSTAGADQLPEVGPVERTSWSAGADTVVPLERSPTDPDIRSGSDPSLSDPKEVRFTPDHQRDQVDDSLPSGLSSPPVEVDNPTEEENEGFRPSGLCAPLPSTASTAKGSPFDDPFSDESRKQAAELNAEAVAREERALRTFEPSTARATAAAAAW